MGNDEHSQNVFKKAVEQGLDPLAYCDRMEEEFRSTWKALDLSFDDFIRTTEPRHKLGVDEMVRRLHAAGDIYEGVYEGWYCVGCEAFKQEKDLVDGHCPLHPTLTPQWIKEKNYFFRLSKYQQPLLDHFAANPEFLQPDIRRNEILRLLESGLEDISVSRAGQSWGIPLPFDPGERGLRLVRRAHQLRVGGRPGQPTRARFEKWWPADLHVIGKDITRFHTVIWPAMLMAAKLPLPRQVFGHGFMTVNGQRMSKSLGTVIDPMDAIGRIKELPAFKADPLRLYLAKEITFGGDGDFSWERYEQRYNVDLANNFGNLVSRVSTMVERYLGGRVLAGRQRQARCRRSPTEACRQLSDRRWTRWRSTRAPPRHSASSMRPTSSSPRPHRGPWPRTPRTSDRLAGVLFDAAEAVRVAAALLRPFMPGVDARDAAARRRARRDVAARSRTALDSREGTGRSPAGRASGLARKRAMRAGDRRSLKTQTGPAAGQKDPTVDAPIPAPPPPPAAATRRRRRFRSTTS